MQREQLIVGHWYQGKSGHARQVSFIDSGRTYLHYYRENDTASSTIWMDAFLRWAKRDLGPELPKEQA